MICLYFYKILFRCRWRGAHVAPSFPTSASNVTISVSCHATSVQNRWHAYELCFCKCSTWHRGWNPLFECKLRLKQDIRTSEGNFWCLKIFCLLYLILIKSVNRWALIENVFSVKYIKSANWNGIRHHLPFFCVSDVLYNNFKLPKPRGKTFMHGMDLSPKR